MRRAGCWLLLLIVTSGCSRRAEEPEPAAPSGPEPIRIGAVFPLSTGAGRIGEMKRQGADLAVEHLNAAGGVNGRPLAIVYADSKNSTSEAQTAFTRLVTVDGVPVVMSAMSQVSLALAPVADRRQVVLFANASHPELAAKSPFVFRNLPSTGRCAVAMAEAAFRELKLTKLAILYLNDEYGAEARRVFAERFTSLGGEVVGEDSFERTGTDFRAALTRLGQQSPDGWWIPGYGAALGLALKQKAELQLPGVTLCDLGLVDDNVLESAGPAADGAVVVTPLFDPADERELVQTFVKEFGEKYHEAPSFDAAFQYDAVYLIADAMRRAGSLTGDAIREALAATSGFVGVCGPTSFDPDGDARMEVTVRMMADRSLHPLERVPPPPATDPADALTDTRPSDELGGE